MGGKRAILAGAVVLGLVLAAVPPLPAAEKEVKVGVLLAMSGPLAAMGENLRMAYDYALKGINDSGGIKSLGGARVKFVHADHQADPKVAAAETERLIMREKVPAILGTFPSSVAYAATEVAERYQVPFLEPVSVMDQITERGFKYVFRMIHPASQWGASQIKFIASLRDERKQPIKKLGLVYENTDQGQATAKGWRKYAPAAGLEIVLDEAYPRDQSDFTPLMLKLKDKKPDVILMVTYISDAILLQKGFYEHRIEPVAFIGSSSGHSDPSFVRQVGKSAEYLFDLTEWAADLKHTPLVKEVAEGYQAWNKDKRPMNSGAAYCFAGAWVLKDALERAGSTKPEAIRKALAETNLSDGPASIVPFSPIRFDDQGQAKETTVIMIQYRDGQRQTVWPEKVKALDPVVPFPKWDGR